MAPWRSLTASAPEVLRFKGARVVAMHAPREGWWVVHRDTLLAYERLLTSDARYGGGKMVTVVDEVGKGDAGTWAAVERSPEALWRSR